MNINIININCLWVSWCLYVLNNTEASCETQIMKTLSNFEAELKKSVAYKTKAFKQSGTFYFLKNWNYSVLKGYLLFYKMHFKWVQKQPSRGVLKQIYRRTPIPKCNFNKGAEQLYWEIALRHGCSPLNLLHIFKTPFPKNTSGWLLLWVNIQKKAVFENQTSF